MRKTLLGICILLSMTTFASESKTKEIKKEEVSKQVSKDSKNHKQAGINEYRNEFFAK